jgi:hypothetical protein
MKTKHKTNNKNNDKIQQSKNFQVQVQKFTLQSVKTLNFKAQEMQSEKCVKCTKMIKSCDSQVQIAKFGILKSKMQSLKFKTYDHRSQKTQKPQIDKLKTQDSKLPLPKTHKP